MAKLKFILSAWPELLHRALKMASQKSGPQSSTLGTLALSLPLRQLTHQLRVEFLISMSPHSSNFVTALVMLVFAVVFLIVGMARVVEYDGFHFGAARRTSFYVIHIIGCIALALGLALFAIDPALVHRTLLASLLGGGFCLLAPLQIYVGLLRRIQLKKS